jgi:hypothetical protein
MKTDDIYNTAPRLQTINECLRVLPETYPAHSNGKPGVPSMTTHISVRFAPISPVQLQIKTSHENSLNPE